MRDSVNLPVNARKLERSSNALHHSFAAQVIAIDDKLTIPILDQTAMLHAKKDLNKQPAVIDILPFAGLQDPYDSCFHLSDLLALIRSLATPRIFRLAVDRRNCRGIGYP